MTPKDEAHAKPAKLKCKFCRVKVSLWKKTKGGRIIDGFDTLKEHMMLYHPEEADKMEITWL